jgi:hypothetical protein
VKKGGKIRHSRVSEEDYEDNNKKIAYSPFNGSSMF